MSTNFGDLALAYYAAGWRIHPCAPHEKKPMLPRWPSHAYRHASEVAADWAQTPLANIGLVCGPHPAVASPLVAIDCDGKAMLDRALDCLPATPASTISGSGDGGHLIYRWQGDTCPKKCKLLTGSGKHSEIAWHGTGSQVVLPGSIHPAGGIYRWCASDNPFDIPAMADIPVLVFADLAPLWPAPVEQPRSYRSETVADLSSVRMSDLARDAGIYRRDLGNGKHAVICPWVRYHTDPDYSPASKSSEAVVFDPTGQNPSGFHCFHGCCEGKKAADFMVALGIGMAEQYAMRQKTDRRAEYNREQVAKITRNLPWNR